MRGGGSESVQPAIRLILRELSPHNVHTTNTQNYKQNVWSWGQQRYRCRGPFRRGIEKQEEECRGILFEIFTIFPSYMRSCLLIKYQVIKHWTLDINCWWLLYTGNIFLWFVRRKTSRQVVIITEHQSWQSNANQTRGQATTFILEIFLSDSTDTFKRESTNHILNK